MRDELKRFAFIDGFRGWAALGVLAVHCQSVGLPPDWAKPLAGAGARGVQLFFLISAFTLFYSLTARSASDVRPFYSFFIRRFFRIAPLFYLVLAYSVYAGSTAPGYWAPDGVSHMGVLLTALFLNGWHPELITSAGAGGWSIAVEMNFYLLLPLLFLSVRKIWVAVACIPLAYGVGRYIAKTIARAYEPYFSEDHMYLVHIWRDLLSFPAELYVFFAGIAVFFLWKKYSFLLESLSEKLCSCVLYGLTLALIAVFYLSPKLPYIVGIMAFIIFVGSRAETFLLRGRFIRFLGKISYSMYLFHFFVYTALPTLQLGVWSWPAAIGLTLLLTIPLAWLGYTLVERPFQRLGGILIKKYFAAPGNDLQEREPAPAK